MAEPRSDVSIFRPESRPTAVAFGGDVGHKIETSSACSRGDSQRFLLRRAQQDLCVELMLMLRLALGPRSPFAPLKRGATSVRSASRADDEGSGLRLLERLLMECGDPSMGSAFVSRVARYLAEPPVVCRTVPRLSFAGLRPSLQGLRLRRMLSLGGAVPRLSLSGLRPCLQGWPDLLGALSPASRSEASAESARSASSSEGAANRRNGRSPAGSADPGLHETIGEQTGSLTVVPHLCFVGLRPSLQGSSGLLGALPSEEGAREARLRRDAVYSHTTRPAGGSHRGNFQCCYGWGSVAAAAPVVVGSPRKEAVRPCAVPRLHLVGLPPSLHGSSGLGAPPPEVFLSDFQSSAARPRQTASPRKVSRKVPRLELVGLRPSLQGWPSWIPPAATMCC